METANVFLPVWILVTGVVASLNNLIYIFPGNGVVAVPANILPDLTQICLAYNKVLALRSSNINEPKTFTVFNSGVSQSNIS